MDQSFDTRYAHLIPRLVAKAFPHSLILNFTKLTGGLINSNFRIRLDSTEQPLVLRIYQRDSEAYAREVGLLQLVRRTVPVPQVLYAETDAREVGRPFAILSYIDGISFRELKRRGNTEATQHAAYEIGKVLAAIGHYSSDHARALGIPFAVTETFIQGPDPVPRFLERCLSSSILQARVEDESRTRLRDFIWSWAPRLATVENEQRLVHCDFGSRNILLRAREANAPSCEVAGIIDWEFAFFGSPLIDIGHFLRYERPEEPLREPHFSRGYLEGGGTLPTNWRELARVLDLTALVELLTRPELPNEIVAELLGLIRDTLQNDGDGVRL